MHRRKILLTQIRSVSFWVSFGSGTLSVWQMLVSAEPQKVIGAITLHPLFFSWIALISVPFVGWSVVWAIYSSIRDKRAHDNQMMVEDVEQVYQQFLNTMPWPGHYPAENEGIVLVSSANLLRNRLLKLGYEVPDEGWTADDQSLEQCFELFRSVRMDLA